MTLGALEIKKVRKYLGKPKSAINPLHFKSMSGAKPLSGKALATRLKGLLSKKAANQLDHYITESCGQIDD